ncbi:MAG TPA: hypothetical protein DHU65_00125 [Clostridiales bacterium]|nr:hypothetical protein [Clostridiales bacterium]
MPLFKCSASKAKPKNGIRYITDPKKAAFVSAKNLFEDEDYAKQFEETAKRFSKGEKFDERKYYHFKLSCARKDNVTPRRAHDFAEEVAEAFFKNYECVIATHTDTETVHSHIIVNAVEPITGKKLQFGKAEYVAMKDEVNRIGKEHGYTETDFRKRSKNSRTSIEKKIILKCGTSWKEELREVIAEGIKNSKTSEEFKGYLDKCYGVKIMRDCKDYSYLHPEKQKPVRGAKLGENYTKTEVIKRIGKQNYRQKSGSYIGRRSGFEGKSVGNRTVRRGKTVDGGNAGSIIRASLSGIEREMQRLNFAAECAGGGLDAASEERRMDERRARDEAERKRRAADERYERGQSELIVESADNASKDNGNGNGNTTANKYNYGKGD